MMFHDNDNYNQQKTEDMEDKKTQNIRKWLESIMPEAIKTLVASLTEKKLQKMKKREGHIKIVFIDLKEHQTPISGIKFYVTVLDGKLMFAILPVIIHTAEDYTPEIAFGFDFDFSEFANCITDDEYIHILVHNVMRQYRKATKNLQ